MTFSTQALKVHFAQQLYESVSEQSPSNYYVYVGRPQPWTNDTNPPDPDQSYSGINSIYNEMLFGKVVSNSDISILASRYNWTANTVYDHYDDQDPNLFNKKFFVVTDQNPQYHVFKCLNNNNGNPSTVMPLRENTSEVDDSYFTSDGYQWKYLYTIEKTAMEKFGSPSMIPVIQNANTVAAAVPRAIDTILVEYPGVKYDCYSNGYFYEVAVGGDLTVHTIDPASSANNGYYINSSLKVVQGPGNGELRRIVNYIVSGGQKRVVIDTPFNELPTTASKYEITPGVQITGDGVGATARAIVNPSSNTIQQIEVVTKGRDYTYATAMVTSNTGVVSLNNAIANSDAILRPIIAPPFGHGGDAVKELGAASVGFSITLNGTENSLISSHGSFRQVGLIRDPKFANVSIAFSDANGAFSVGETVYQKDRNATGVVTQYNSGSSTIKLTNATSGFVSNVEIFGSLSNTVATVSNIQVTGVTKTFGTFDQRVRLNITNNSGTFNDFDKAVQDTTEASGYVHESNTTFVALYSPTGTFVPTANVQPYLLTTNTASANINSITQPDVIKGSGDVLYIDNIQPISRGDLQSEIVKFIVRF